MNSPKKLVRLTFFAMLVLAATATFLTGCTYILPQPPDPQSLNNDRALKTRTISLVSKATDPYQQHAPEVAQLSSELNSAATRDKARNSNTAPLWDALLQANPKTPGSGIYTNFVNRWQQKRSLTPARVQDSSQNISDAFDKIISLESSKSN